jgi:acetylglutamate kinase
MIKDGVIKGGMIPKVKACIQALEKGVNKAHILDGRLPHCILLEIFTKKGVGTEITL